jgi:hypothetical protein
MPDKYLFDGGVAETTLTPLALAVTCLACTLILFLPRKQLIIPFALTLFLVPSSQTFVVGSIHFFVFRVVILVACLRIVPALFDPTNPAFGGGVNVIDKLFVVWAVGRAAVFLILYGEGSIVNQLGFLWDTLGSYFFFRYAIEDGEGTTRTVKVLAYVVVLVGVLMIYEQVSLNNLFSVLGSQASPDIRDGNARSQGPFAHAIPAGVFGATIVPLLVGLWSSGRNRILALCAMFGATAMVLTSASSTSIAAYAAAILALCMWPLRGHMREFRWSIVAALLGLALVMKAPVWFLLARIDLVGGSSGYHRALLVDQTIRRFGEWWLFGASNNQSWGFDMWDTQNQFVTEAVRGGLLALVLSMAILSRCFGRVGTARKLLEARPAEAWQVWTLGALITTHVVAFFGSNYFDQSRFWWYLTLAIIAASTAPVLAKSATTGLPEWESGPDEPSRRQEESEWFQIR